MIKTLTLAWTVITFLFAGTFGNVTDKTEPAPKECIHSYSLVAVEVPDTCSHYNEGEYPYITGIKAELKCENCGEAVDVSDKIESGKDAIGRDTSSFTIKYENYECDIPVTVTPIWRIAFCGDSITEGWADNPIYKYTTYVGKFLSRKARISNFGVGGISVTGYGGNWRNPDDNYLGQEVFNKVISANPDLIVIMLGSNDASQWDKAAETFESDYKKLISAFREKLPDAEIVIATTPPSEIDNRFGILNSVITNDIVPTEKRIAEDMGLKLIDVNGIINERGLDGMYVDGVHIKNDGVLVMAKIMTDHVCEILGLEANYGTFFD